MGTGTATSKPIKGLKKDLVLNLKASFKVFNIELQYLITFFT